MRLPLVSRFTIHDSRFTLHDPGQDILVVPEGRELDVPLVLQITMVISTMRRLRGGCP